MERLLNGCFNFSVLPNKLDLTHIIIDYKRYERTAIWIEFWFIREQQNLEKQIFRSHKYNLPKNYSTPEGIKIF